MVASDSFARQPSHHSQIPYLQRMCKSVHDGCLKTGVVGGLLRKTAVDAKKAQNSIPGFMLQCGTHVDIRQGTCVAEAVGRSQNGAQHGMLVADATWYS